MDLLLHSVLPFVGILLALMVIHEAGHYFTAKLFGVKVLEAGIGLPPRIWGFRWRDTDYTINALPMGAFVRMLGEEDPTDPQSLAAQPKWKRTIIIGAGAVMNLIAAFALFTVALMVPRTISAGGAEIADVVPNSPAERAGLQPGDLIVEVNGREAESTADASYLIRLYQGSTIDLTVKRNDPRSGSQLLTLPVYARWNPGSYIDECGIKQTQGPTGITIGTRYGQYYAVTAQERADLFPRAKQAYIEHRDSVAPGSPATCLSGAAFGFKPMFAAQCDELDAAARAEAQALRDELFPQSQHPCYEFDPPPNFAPFTRSRHEPPWEAVPHGLRLSLESLVMARNQVWTWIRGYANPQFAGPVGIAQTTGQVVEAAGWISLIEFAALLSMNLGVLNLLPIPMVDGGRLVFILIEFLRRGRRIAPQKEALVHLTGFAAMILLVVVITYFDILRWVNGDSLLR